MAEGLRTPGATTATTALAQSISETQEAAQAQRDASGHPRCVCLAAQVRVPAKMAELKAQLIEGVEVRTSAGVLLGAREGVRRDARPARRGGAVLAAEGWGLRVRVGVVRQLSAHACS